MTHEHQHEAWQVRPVVEGEQAVGDPHYCAACGDRVRWIEPTGHQRADEGEWISVPKPTYVEIAQDHLVALQHAAKTSRRYERGDRHLIEAVEAAQRALNPPSSQTPVSEPLGATGATSQASDPEEALNPPSTNPSWRQGDILAYPIDDKGEAIRPTKPHSDYADPESDYADAHLSGSSNQGVVHARATYCKRCGSLVGNQSVHDEWHEGPSIEAMEKALSEPLCGVHVPGKTEPCILVKGHEKTQPKGKRNHEDSTGYLWSASR